ncbi:uroporphyrinogen decarboxylase [Candidatus Brocadiaceae bacterium]|nr:uroporphyrinogen decarboxylase [Candidatus Brocadiaceae bacterium]
MKLQNDLLLRALRHQPVERTPIWIMRQAGRYLPEYMAVRKKASFTTMYKTPELAAEVTVQPVDLIGVDAAILFSDILVVPEAMGMDLVFTEGKGPVFSHPLRTSEDIAALKHCEPDQKLSFVAESIRQVNAALNARVPLIGFSGAPWTLMVYMIEGMGTKEFSYVKEFIYTRPDLAHQLLGMIADNVAAYLNSQIEAGVHAVQIFDTWAGILSPAHYEEFSLPYITRVIQQLKREHTPVIAFPKGAHASLAKTAACGADGVGLDWTIEIGEAKKITGSRVALQGNLDPLVLLGSQETIKKEVDRVLNSYGAGSGHVFNLGHGIIPRTSPDAARFLVRYLQEKSPAFHKMEKA